MNHVLFKNFLLKVKKLIKIKNRLVGLFKDPTIWSLTVGQYR